MIPGNRRKVRCSWRAWLPGNSAPKSGEWTGAKRSPVPTVCGRTQPVYANMERGGWRRLEAVCWPSENPWGVSTCGGKTVTVKRSQLLLSASTRELCRRDDPAKRPAQRKHGRAKIQETRGGDTPGKAWEPSWDSDSATNGVARWQGEGNLRVKRSDP